MSAPIGQIANYLEAAKKNFLNQIQAFIDQSLDLDPNTRFVREGTQLPDHLLTDYAEIRGIQNAAQTDDLKQCIEDVLITPHSSVMAAFHRRFTRVLESPDLGEGGKKNGIYQKYKDKMAGKEGSEEEL